MKPTPAPSVPGDTPGERLSNALKSVLSLSKADLVKAEEKWKREHPKKKRPKKAA